MASRPLFHILTTIALVLVAAVAQAPAPAPADSILRPTAPFCSTTGNYTAGSQYQKNLAELLARMPAAATNNSWFYTGTAGEGADQAHGLIACFADVNATQCQDCLTRGPAAIASSVCPGSRTVNAAYDACVLRYSDAPIPAVDDVAFYMYEVTGADVDDPESLDLARSSLMGELATAAAASEARVANGSEPCAGAAEDVYRLAQCTRDLTSGQCATCLEGYVDRMGEVFGDYTGGAIKGYSCYVRYRIGAFDITMPPSPAVPPPATQPSPPSAPPTTQPSPPSSPPATQPSPPSAPPTAQPSPPPAPVTPPSSPPPAPTTQPPSPPPAPATQPPSSPPVPASPPSSPPPAPATQPPSPPPTPATQPLFPPPVPASPPSSPPPAPPTQPPSPPPAPATQPPSSPAAPPAQPPSTPPCPCEDN